MNRAILGVAIGFGAMAATASTVRADDNASELTAQPTMFANGRGYVRVDAPEPSEAVQHFSNVLFLNRCEGGCNLTFGNDNSSTNQSTVGQGYLPEFRWSDQVWTDVVDCVREIFEPFDIDVTTTDPGATEHMEAMIAGEACDLSGSPGWEFQCNFILGVAPFTCDYEYIPRAISFTFANDGSYGAGSHASNVNTICSTIGQEVAHTWGLDHELLASDPMTYLSYNGRRTFKDQLVDCGEYSGQPHGCGESVGCTGTPAKQNSVQRILEHFGPSSPTPPHITITDPADGAEVTPGFSIHAESDEALSRAELRIDSQLVETLNDAPYTFTAPADLGQGSHHVEVRGYDLQNTPGSAAIDIVVGEPCDSPDDCADLGEDYTCVDGRCVPGEGSPGGLGAPCEGNEDCFSGVCLTNGNDRLCVESCDVAADGCPDGFDCVDYDGGGVCWPGTGDGGGGCSSTTSDDSRGALPITIGLALAFFATRRRRRV